MSDLPRSQTFDSLAAMVRRCRELPWAGKGRPVDKHDKWSGDVTLAEACDLATYGWPDGTRQAEIIALSMGDKIVRSAPYMDTVWASDVTGAAYDVGAYLASVPECWVYPSPEVTRRAVHIIVNCCASGGVSADTLFTRGIAVSALCLCLQSLGYPVTLDWEASARARHGSGHDWTIRTRLADAADGSVLDIDRIVFALAHPAMFRKMCATVADEYRHESHMGTAWGASQPKDFPVADAIYLGGVHLRDVERWQDGGSEWIMQQIMEQTGGGGSQ